MLGNYLWPDSYEVLSPWLVPVTSANNQQAAFSSRIITDQSRKGFALNVNPPGASVSSHIVDPGRASNAGLLTTRLCFPPLYHYLLGYKEQLPRNLTRGSEKFRNM